MNYLCDSLSSCASSFESKAKLLIADVLNCLERPLPFLYHHDHHDIVLQLCLCFDFDCFDCYHDDQCQDSYDDEHGDAVMISFYIDGNHRQDDDDDDKLDSDSDDDS